MHESLDAAARGQTTHTRSFASDNYAGVHPRVLEALAQVNQGHARAYGDDQWTERATRVFRETFGRDCVPYLVFVGTAANVLAIRSVCRRHHSVICARQAHINNDECAAPESQAGVKLVAAPSGDGKVRPADLSGFLGSRGFVHHAQPRLVSITQPTELGAVYTLEEILALADFAHAHDLYLHMDGARLANAAAALDVSLAALTAQCGVDVLSFGGTKNGLMCAESVVFFDEALAEDFAYLRKQSMQLASKMRFLAAQFLAFFQDDLWLENARHANRMALRLARGAARIPGVELARPAVTNAVFARLPASAVEALQREWSFHVWDQGDDPLRPEVRWMTAYDTAPGDVDAFLTAMRLILAAGA